MLSVKNKRKMRKKPIDWGFLQPSSNLPNPRPHAPMPNLHQTEHEDPKRIPTAGPAEIKHRNNRSDSRPTVWKIPSPL